MLELSVGLKLNLPAIDLQPTRHLVTIRLEDRQAAQTVQHDAAHAPQQQVRLVAGPGSGKSSTIEERVYWLLEQHVEPGHIAVVSFTNASVVDLRGKRVDRHC